MEEKKIEELVNLFSKEFTEVEFANLLRKIDFELINLTLNNESDIQPDKDVISMAHYYLHKFANIIDPIKFKAF